MKPFYTAFLLLTSLFHQVLAQQKSPHVSGEVEINRAEGLIKCDLYLNNLPDLGKQYKVLLNRGFNIGLWRDDSGKVLKYSGFYDSNLLGEAVPYLPYSGNDTLKLPAKLRLTYTGAFPVYIDTLNSFDFKGFIAFNSNTVRAADQSKWYPVIYDVKNDRELQDVTYDIDVTCKDCETIYINGSAAKAGPQARLRSNVARPLLLFAGNYKVQPLENSTFLNAELTPDEAAVFNENINTIVDFYKSYLKVPFGAKITFLQHQAVEPYGPKRSWGFVTFPTIAVAGKSFKSEIDTQKRLFVNTYSYAFYAHEMGHYYFGNVLKPNSTLKWFFLESMAEFLSIKATENKYGKDATRKYIDERRSMMKDWKVKPLPEITKPDQIGEGYRYNYAPLMLLVMERRFGTKAMQLFCQKALQNAGKETDYNLLVNTVKSAGISNEQWQLFEKEVISQSECKKVFDYL
ncbi:hypothetical protein LT679_00850 [Mucilaginibacter roseus]|uniref:Peptidase M1 membrane alanine aminopeptidase domain-containing protein n=1 Tax=Mucilaginibacter roseus TaxID=1528868 RepID=A0ABS8U0U3_9SPHI|nr:hypothetical protein [Mucilaginibacter roseus]MCD8739133.1 hypothetical protein [Mucilaginibacter roseus]